jgi:cell division protein FtsB
VTDGPRRRPRPSGAKPAARRAPAKPRPAATKATAKKPVATKASATKASATKASATKASATKASAKKASVQRSSATRAASGRRPFGRIAAGLVVSVALVGFLLVGVFPTRTWLAQREETKERQAELDRIRAEQAVHEERIAELEDPDEIEAAARDKLGLVMPDETAIRMLPRPVPPVDLPDTWPFTGADDWLNR